jgi:hypothetical protein
MNLRNFFAERKRRHVYKPAIVYGVVALAARQGRDPSPLLEIASVLVRLDHVARFIKNANHGIM